jgi:Mg-chelatase subunit ChlD
MRIGPIVLMAAAALAAVEGCSPTDAPVACPDAEVVYEAQSVGVNLLFLLDRSGSMHLTVPSGATRWSATKAALFEMFDSLEDRANGAITMFPAGDAPLTCCPAANPQCGECGPEDVPAPANRCSFESYSEVSFDLMTQETIDLMKGTVAVSDNAHYWGTPLAAAMQGAVDSIKATDNGWETVIVLLTDGKPAACATDADPGADNIQIAVRATEAAAELGVKTYVVGVIDGNQAADASHLSQLATSGGTARYEGCEADDDCAYSVGIETFAEDASKALKDIAVQATSCTFALGEHGLEQQPAVVIADGSVTTPIELDEDHVDGWDWLNGSHIQFYGEACELFKTSPSAKVQVLEGCTGAL